jgi:tRNA pseudouridine55 synthase
VGGRRCVGRGPGPIGVFGSDGTLLVLMGEYGPVTKPLTVFVP